MIFLENDDDTKKETKGNNMKGKSSKTNKIEDKNSGNESVKTTNTPKKASYDKSGLLIILIIVIVSVIFYFVIMNISNSPTSVIESDIRKLKASLGYSTTYTIGEVERVSCSEEENDGNGRYIIRCNVTYYPKRNNGTIAQDSKMQETIYAAYIKENGDNYSRLYTKNVNNYFKTKVCWGKDKSAGLICS